MVFKTIGVRIFIIVAGICLLMSCDEDVSVKPGALPPYTDTGANIISYYIGNKLFFCRDNTVYTNNHCRFDLPSGIVDTDTVFFMYGDFRTDTNYNSLQFRMLHVNDTGKYEISVQTKSGFNQILYRVGHNESDFVEYVTLNNYKGELYVKKLDTVNKIIAGTFKANLKIWKYGTETITITNGQFDFKYEMY